MDFMAFEQVDQGRITGTQPINIRSELFPGFFIVRPERRGLPVRRQQVLFITNGMGQENPIDEERRCDDAGDGEQPKWQTLPCPSPSYLSWILPAAAIFSHGFMRSALELTGISDKPKGARRRAGAIRARKAQARQPPPALLPLQN